MDIYRKVGKMIVREIRGQKTPLHCVAAEIVDTLGIGTGCNMYNVLITLAKYKLSPKKEKCIAWVERIFPGKVVLRRVIPGDVRCKGAFVAKFDADQIKPEDIKEFINKAIPTI